MWELFKAILFACAAVIAFVAYACVKVLAFGFTLLKKAAGPFIRSAKAVATATAGKLATGAAQVAPAPMAVQRDRLQAVEVGRDIASYHVCIVFSDDFAASLSVFKETGLVRRKMKATSDAAAELMMRIYQRVGFDLTDSMLSAECSMEKILLETESNGIKFIEDLLKVADPAYFGMPGEQLKPNCEPPAAVAVDEGKPVEVLKPDLTEEEQAGRSLALLRGSMLNTVATTVVAPTEVKTTVTMAKREAKGCTTGRVETCGMRDIPPTAGKAGYQTFEATILQSDGLHVSFRGVRLNELFVENGVKPGDVVEIQSLGRTKVSQVEDDSRPTWRNEYIVKVLEAA